MNKVDDDLTPEQRPRSRDDFVPELPPEDPSLLVSGVTGVLRALSWLTPRPFGRDRVLWLVRRPRGSRFDEIYLLVWVFGALVPCFILSGPGDGGAWCTAVVLYFAFDLFVNQSLRLLDPLGLDVRNARRNLVLGAVELGGLALAVATVFRWQLDQRLGASLTSGFDTVTLRGPSAQTGNWLDAAVAVGTVGALIIYVGILASMVARSRLSSS